MNKHIIFRKELGYFQKFLKDNDILKEYIAEVTSQRAEKTRECWKHPINYPNFLALYVSNPSVWICNAFEWAKSDKGYDYWQEKNKKWIEVWGKLRLF